MSPLPGLVDSSQLTQRLRPGLCSFARCASSRILIAPQGLKLVHPARWYAGLKARSSTLRHTSRQHADPSLASLVRDDNQNLADRNVRPTQTSLHSNRGTGEHQCMPAPGPALWRGAFISRMSGITARNMNARSRKACRNARIAACCCTIPKMAP